MYGQAYQDMFVFEWWHDFKRQRTGTLCDQRISRSSKVLDIIGGLKYAKWIFGLSALCSLLSSLSPMDKPCQDFRFPTLGLFLRYGLRVRTALYHYQRVFTLHSSGFVTFPARNQQKTFHRMRYMVYARWIGQSQMAVYTLIMKAAMRRLRPSPIRPVRICVLSHVCDNMGFWK